MSNSDLRMSEVLAVRRTLAASDTPLVEPEPDEPEHREVD